MTRPTIVIFNDTHGWHSQQLITAFHALDVDIVLSDLADCRIDLDSPSGLFIPEFEHTLPDAVMVRGIAPGSFEQITLRMDVLHTLAELGVPVFNSAKAIEHTVDKARTSLRLHLAGINTPKTWACENKQLAFATAQAEFDAGHSLIIKPLFGCQGKGIAKLNNIADLNNYAPVGDAFYLQRYVPPFVENDWQDWRLFVIDNQVCAAMSRRSNHWITNFAQGAQVFATTVSQEMEAIAIKATQAVNADYAGVDLIRQADGNYSVLEVNSVPAWKGLYQATNLNVATDLAQALVNRINNKNQQTQSTSC